MRLSKPGYWLKRELEPRLLLYKKLEGSLKKLKRGVLKKRRKLRESQPKQRRRRGNDLNVRHKRRIASEK